MCQYNNQTVTVNCANVDTQWLTISSCMHVTEKYVNCISLVSHCGIMPLQFTFCYCLMYGLSHAAAAALYFSYSTFILLYVALSVTAACLSQCGGQHFNALGSVPHCPLTHIPQLEPQYRLHCDPHCCQQRKKWPSGVCEGYHTRSPR